MNSVLHALTSCTTDTRVTEIFVANSVILVMVMQMVNLSGMRDFD